jgi:hypothetical protein
MHLGVALVVLIGHAVVAFYIHIACSIVIRESNHKSDKKESQTTPISQILLRSHNNRTARARFKGDKQEEPIIGLMKVYYGTMTTLPDSESPHEMSINELVNKLAIKKSEMEECKLINNTSGRQYKLWIY